MAWIHRYESCGDVIQKLLPEDLVTFIDAVIFTKYAREMVMI